MTLWRTNNWPAIDEMLDAINDDEWRATDWATVAELVTIGDMGGFAVADYGKSITPPRVTEKSQPRASRAEAIAQTNCSRNSGMNGNEQVAPG
jgi:hypothetical protein